LTRIKWSSGALASPSLVEARAAAWIEAEILGGDLGSRRPDLVDHAVRGTLRGSNVEAFISERWPNEDKGSAKKIDPHQGPSKISRPSDPSWFGAA
jgi:hypothetical protein